MRAALDAARGHPRQLALAGLTAGLLTAPLPPVAAIALAAGMVAIAGRPGLALLVAAAVLAGAIGADARVAALDRSALGPLLGREVTLRAALLEQPRTARSGARAVRVRIVSGLGAGETLRVRLAGPRRPGVTDGGPAWPIAPTGAVLELRGRLVRLAPREGFERRRAVHAALDVVAARWDGGVRGGAAGALDAVRGRAERGLAAGLAPAEAALLRGMVLGQDEAIAEPVREDFRRSGLAHLLAVSGQNVMLLAALAFPLAAALGLGLRARLVAVLALIAVYVPLAGAGPSIQRAGVMGAAGIVAGLAGRPASRWYAVLLAAAVTLVANPRAAGDPGWQLSFAAVGALLAWAPRLAVALRARGIPAAAADAAAVTAAATAGTAPLLALHFGRVSLVSLAANLLAAPAVAPLMWLGMVSAALGQLTLPGAALVNALTAYPLGYLEWLAHVTARAPHATVAVGPAGAGALLALLAAAAVAGHVRRTRRPLALAALVGAAALLALRPWAVAVRPPPRGALTVSFLDVGQGDATLLQHDGATVLVDTGPSAGPILERLRRAGVGRLDLLVITHAQADHEGAAAAVLARHPVGVLLDGGEGGGPARAAIRVAAARRRVRRITPDAGQVVRAGPIELRVLWPRREPARRHAGVDPNDRAIVALVRDGDFRLLLPADAESNVTGPLALPTVDALKVAHHGSLDPGLPRLLARLRPRVAAIEVGARNTYGHPTPQALGALRAAGPAVYRTDRDGTVRLTVAGGRLAVATHG